MPIGYARVSATGQSLQEQKELLHQQGCTTIFVEKVTETSTAPRKELSRMLDHIHAGDIVIVTKIDRLARSMIDLYKIVNELTAKGASLRFINENIEFKIEDTNNTLLFSVLKSFAQFERDLIAERTTKGRERAKKQGKHMGRPSQPKKEISKALKMYDEREINKMSVGDITKITGVPRSTIYNELKKRTES